MIRLDRCIAIALFAFSIGYGYLAWIHPILPFEVRMPFKPNTMPLGLAGLGILLSGLLIISSHNDDFVKDAEGWRGFAWKQAILLVVFMVLYALFLRMSGFILATTLFLVAGSRLLGEKNYVRSSFIGLFASVLIWYLVDPILGIYLAPLPRMGGQ
ncbi:tripartite tricarboxylate transporter TctB family protein [Litorivicinus sp.]|nr:tripartite tricarboxylate transporter TctB family protein [Litorivicinus sp.]MDC1466519.1 tripartite tricarboxylate transporter TctB family protein [Litorivicinus sp.]